MTKEQQMVLEFQQTFKQVWEDKPTIPDIHTQELRDRLFVEELDELRTAFAENNLIEIADGLGDLLYILLGTANACGIDLEPVFQEIHRSNMTKIGGTVNEYGKLIKPPTYSKPDLEPILQKQIESRWGLL